MNLGGGCEIAAINQALEFLLVSEAGICIVQYRARPMKEISNQEMSTLMSEGDNRKGKEAH
jgi:hypothetical protein